MYLNLKVAFITIVLYLCLTKCNSQFGKPKKRTPYGSSNSDGNDCYLSDTPKKPMALERSDISSLICPDHNGHVNVKHNKHFKLSCENGKFESPAVLKQTREVSVKCKKGNTLEYQGRSYEYEEFKCNETPESKAKVIKEKCQDSELDQRTKKNAVFLNTPRKQADNMRTKPEMMGQIDPDFSDFSELNISEGFQFDTEMVTNEIKEDCKSLLLSNEQLFILMEDMDKAIRNGLAKETNPSSIVKCYVTYVQDLPNGTERGKFLALDLGGTNFRVLLIELGENNYFHMDSEIFKVPEKIQTGKGTELFDHIAKCLAEFVKKHNLDNKNALPLGFTFSFPLRQVGLTKGYLNSWTKGFNCSGVVNEDVVRLLKDAIKRRKDVEIDVCGILNDTTGTIMSCAWKNPNTRIGLIVGTGCNACYVEKVENAELFDGDKSKPHVIVNTEWGAFGDDGKLDAIRTKYDREIDEDSLNPGQQRFEKMISGMYMGEIVRLAIVDLANQNKLFEGKLSEKMKTKGAFGTSFVSDIESDKANYRETLKVLNEMGIHDPSLVDCANVRYICECVSRRSAHLVSAGLAVLLNKMGEKSVTIGVDGSVYRFHPYFHKLMVEKTKQLTNPDIKFDLMLSEDGSGRGAALVAAVAVRDEPRPTNGVAAI